MVSRRDFLGISAALAGLGSLSGCLDSKTMDTAPEDLKDAVWIDAREQGGEVNMWAGAYQFKVDGKGEYVSEMIFKGYNVNDSTMVDSGPPHERFIAPDIPLNDSSGVLSGEINDYKDFDLLGVEMKVSDKKGGSDPYYAVFELDFTKEAGQEVSLTETPPEGQKHWYPDGLQRAKDRNLKEYAQSYLS